jgi:peptidoglycan DL-endopeptidase CwlS
MKVSRVVLIVVALHVLVIGGIFIFEGCSRAKTTAVETAENPSTPADENAANLPAVPPDSATAQNLTPPVPTSPAVTATPATTTVASAKTYTVKKGDSLWKIAKTEGVSIGDLARANSLSKTTALKVGQKLQVPSKAAPVVAQASVAPTPAGETAAPAAGGAMPMEGNVYIVKTGDSLWKIARSQNVSVTAIKQANNLTSDSLKIGQKLHLPTASASAPTEKTATMAQAGIATTSNDGWREPGMYTENGQTVHVVDIGESPAIIAKKYGIKTDDLMKANQITDAKRIVVGQKLIIPTATTIVPAPAAAMTPAAAAPIVSAKN